MLRSLPSLVDDANCLNVEPDLFYPNRGDLLSALIAKKQCMDCKVRLECLHIGLDENWGIWGGLSEIDRRKIRRVMRRGKDLTQAIAEIDHRTITRVKALSKLLEDHEKKYRVS